MSPAERLRAIAACAASGVAPSVAVLAAYPAETGQWRQAVVRLRLAGLVALPSAQPAPGAPAPLWPGPRAGDVLTPAELAAWEACRDLPSPDDGWVDVEGETLRVVDGVALAREVGAEDWRLLRGGVVVGVVSGRRGRWEVVDVG